MKHCKVVLYSFSAAVILYNAVKAFIYLGTSNKKGIFNWTDKKYFNIQSGLVTIFLSGPVIVFFSFLLLLYLSYLFKIKSSNYEHVCF